MLAVTCGCAARNPAFDLDSEGSQADAEAGDESAEGPAESGEEMAETGFGDEAGEGRCDGDDPVTADFGVVSSTFIRQNVGDDCSPYGIDTVVPLPCNVVDFGAYVEHPVYGMDSVGPAMWDSMPEAAHLLVRFDDAGFRPIGDENPQFDRFQATLRIPVMVTDPDAAGTVEALLMKFEAEHAWLAGMGEGTPPQPGVAVFKYRQFDDHEWTQKDPLSDAFGAPLLSEPLGDLPANTQTFIQAELTDNLLNGFYLLPNARQNGVLISSTAPGPSVIIDVEGIEYSVSACPI